MNPTLKNAGIAAASVFLAANIASAVVNPESALGQFVRTAYQPAPIPIGNPAPNWITEPDVVVPVPDGGYLISRFQVDATGALKTTATVSVPGGLVISTADGGPLPVNGTVSVRSTDGGVIPVALNGAVTIATADGGPLPVNGSVTASGTVGVQGTDAGLIPVVPTNTACSDNTQTVGTDGGLSGCLTFAANSCWRLDTSIALHYRASYLPDAGGALSTDKALFASQIESRCSTGAQAMPDGGAVICVLLTAAGQVGLSTCP